MKENKSKYAILGFLSLAPASGYDIKKAFEKHFSSFWSESYGQIYPMLKRLFADKLAVRSVKRQKNKPDRHIYELTEKGRDELKRWLTAPIDRQVSRHEIILKLLFADQVSVADIISQVERFKDQHRAELQELRRFKKEFTANPSPLPYPVQYTTIAFGYGEQVNRAYIRWCDQALKTLREMSEESE